MGEPVNNPVDEQCYYCKKVKHPLAEKYDPIKETSEFTCRECFKCTGRCNPNYCAVDNPGNCNGTFKTFIIKCYTVGYVCASCGCECSMGISCGIDASMYEWSFLPEKPKWLPPYYYKPGMYKQL